MHTGRSASSATDHRRSQWSVWNDGYPRCAGLSGKLKVFAPFAAQRASSSAASSPSQNGVITIGT